MRNALRDALSHYAGVANRRDAVPGAGLEPINLGCAWRGERSGDAARVGLQPVAGRHGTGMASVKASAGF